MGSHPIFLLKESRNQQSKSTKTMCANIIFVKVFLVDAVVFSVDSCCLFFFFGTKACVRIGYLNGELLSTFDDLLTIRCCHCMSNLGGELAILHQEHFKFLIGETAVLSQRSSFSRDSPWHCSPRTLGNHRDACVVCVCRNRNQWMAWCRHPWNVDEHDCQYHAVYASWARRIDDQE